MSKLRLIPFDPAHYVETFHATTQFQTYVGLPDPVLIAERMARDGVAMSALDGQDRLLGCAGLLIPAWGPATGWLVMHVTAMTLPIPARAQLVRLIRGQFRTWMAEYALRRVEANVNALDGLHQKFIAAIGFHVESEMPHYLRPGEPFFKFVRFGQGLTG